MHPDYEGKSINDVDFSFSYLGTTLANANKFLRSYHDTFVPEDHTLSVLSDDVLLYNVLALTRPLLHSLNGTVDAFDIVDLLTGTPNAVQHDFFRARIHSILQALQEILFKFSYMVEFLFYL